MIIIYNVTCHLYGIISAGIAFHGVTIGIDNCPAIESDCKTAITAVLDVAVKTNGDGCG